VRLARRYLITGRVQGVGFRYFVQEAAWADAIDGWARNLPDGSVEIVAGGDHEAIARFEAQIRRGPRGARVDAVETREAAVPPVGQGFSIR
jgi:acylphosphatase